MHCLRILLLHLRVTRYSVRPILQITWCSARRPPNSPVLQAGAIRSTAPSWSRVTAVGCVFLWAITSMRTIFSGFIPKNQHYFGSRYAETSLQAINSFELDQQRIEGNRKELTTLQNDPSANPAKGLEPIAPKAKPFLSTHIPPFHLQTDKAFMSGYTGFVPKARRYIGEGYPVITMQALKEQASEKRRQILSQNEPVTLTRPLEQTKQSASLHRTHQVGLTPHYTGHVQG